MKKVEDLIKISLIVLLSIYGCDWFTRESNKDIQVWNKNQIITKKGEYHMKEDNITLLIKDKGNILDFQLKDSCGNNLIENSIPSISTVHRWGILMDGDSDILWIQSSDIGLFYANRDSANRYFLKSFGLITEENVQEIPQRIYEILADPLKDKFNAIYLDKGI